MWLCLMMDRWCWGTMLEGVCMYISENLRVGVCCTNGLYVVRIWRFWSMLLPELS